MALATGVRRGRDLLREAIEKIVKVVEAISSVVGAVLVCLVFSEVVFRFFRLPVSPAFEEASNFLFIWWVFLGASVTVHRSGHPRITAGVDRLPGALRRQAELGATTFTLAYFALLSGYGFYLANAGGQPAVSLPIPMTLPYLAVGVGGAVMFIVQGGQSLDMIRLNRWSIVTLIICAVAAWMGLQLASVSPYLFMLLGALVLFAVGVPVASVLGLLTIGTLASTSPAMVLNYPIRLFDGLNNFVLLSIPFFMLTGTLMSQGGISRRLVDFANGLVGWVRGGLGLTDIVASVFFADISGSAVSDTAAIGSVMIPGLVERGYTPRFATALQAAAGSLGMLFPPSITMILYAWVTNQSVARLFASSFLPGLLVATSFAVVTYIIARRHNFPKERRIRPREFGGRFVAAMPALFTPVLILGGILSGLFTATEAGVVAAIYALIVSVLGYRDLHPKLLPAVMVDATVTMSRVIFIAGNAIAFSWVLIYFQGPQLIAGALLGLSHNPVLVLAIVMVLLVLLHTVLEGSSTVVAIVPVLLPVLAVLHVDLVYFGILVMLNSAAGLLMPPIGLCLYISTAISGEKIEAVAKAVLPFVVAILVDIAILLAIPRLVSVVPDLILTHP